MKEVETFVGPCSKFVSGQGWTTEIPVEQLKAKGYIKQKTCENVIEMHPTDGFTCSECGITLVDFIEEQVDEACGASWKEYRIKYCPNCGAKVTEVK